MDPQDYSAPTSYRPPSPWYRRLNRLGVVLGRLGLVPRDVVVLEVRGRRTGRARRTPVLCTPLDGERYLVALAGESQWLRNARADGGRAVLRRRGAEHVRLVEVPPGDRAPVIAEYLRRGRERGGPGAAAEQARWYFGLPPDPTLDDIRTVADRYPVLLVVHGDGP